MRQRVRRMLVLEAPLVLLLLLTAGCTRGKPEPPASEPQIVATQPGAPRAAKPAAPATPQPAPVAAPAPTATPPAPQAPSKAAPPVAKTPAAAPPLDLKTLEQQLKDTKAIGFFTKITLKNQVDDLLDKFREYHQGKAKLAMTDLRRSYKYRVYLNAAGRVVVEKEK